MRWSQIAFATFSYKPPTLLANRFGDGSGQGAILNYALSGYTFNSADNPAEKGSAVTMYATGFGAWDAAVLDGSISLGTSAIGVPPVVCADQCNKPANVMSLTIGGKPAKLIYTGASAYEPWSLLQINAVIPADVDSGQQQVVLTVGHNDNRQQNVTVAVR